MPGVLGLRRHDLCGLQFRPKPPKPLRCCAQLRLVHQGRLHAPFVGGLRAN